MFTARIIVDLLLLCCYIAEEKFNLIDEKINENDISSVDSRDL